MTEQDLINLLEASFPDAEISVSLDGSHVDITVVAAEFEGLRPVARQQRVYAPLATLIADAIRRANMYDQGCCHSSVLGTVRAHRYDQALLSFLGFCPPPISLPPPSLPSPANSKSPSPKLAR